MTPEEGSAHVVSPAIADDDLVFQEYLSNEPSSLGRRMIRSHATMTQSSSAKARPIMFHIVPKRGQREIQSRRLAQSHLIALEELLDPYHQDLIDLFFAKVNICFPIFDEEMFRRTYTTSKESNGAMLGMAVALANSFGLNRDPSHWNLSPSEKRFRIRIWWLLVIYDVWSSLAYGTPPHVHHSQCDVPTPTAEDIFGTSASSDRMAAAECFVALITLTQVLSHCLEHVYKLESFVTNTDLRPDLDSLLVIWEDSLPTDELRRSVLRGTKLNAPGTANLRLAYLSVRLLICRSRLSHDNNSKEDIDSHHNIQARRVCEDIVHLVQELDEACLADFWIPLNAHALTSATTFLMRTALRSKDSVRNPSLKLARTMIDTLQWYRRQYEWDMAENCIANCGDILDKIELVCNAVDQYPAELDLSFLEGLDFAIDTHQY
ncbi:hypothetical protein LTR27_000658 [Elasticomyces elasticus]|nr:hypothetical protein LTR27_000658 [Elasticomyces elasticus]